MRAAVSLMLATLAAGAELRLVTLDPAHFHAAQIYYDAPRGFARDAWVFAPAGRDLAGFWKSVADVTAASSHPDHWHIHLYAGSDFREKFASAHAGDVLLLSGRNARTLDSIEAGLRSGMHVLADKPWIIEANQLDQLVRVLDEAEARKLVVYDCMTLRFDVAYRLQRELVNDRAVFGEIDRGSPERPAVRMESSHFLVKGTTLRPAWYFDITQQGEALADVGTHVVDLVHWTLFADQALDYRKDFGFLKARRWPTILTEDQFRRATGERGFPPFLLKSVHDGKFAYYTNNSLLYTVRGVHVALRVDWDYESPAGDRDSMLAVYRGTRAEIALRASKEQNYTPEIDVTPVGSAGLESLRSGLEKKLASLAGGYPGLRVEERGGRLHVVIPPSLRTSDLGYFDRLAERVAEFAADRTKLPAWEKPNTIAKYYVTTKGVALARASEEGK